MLGSTTLATAPLLASAVTVALGIGDGRDGKLYVPRGHRIDRPAPLLVLFHGAGANGKQMVELAARLADERGFLVLAPDSRGTTWDFEAGGADAAFLVRAMAAVAARWPIDHNRLAVGGFSDGASEALALGLDGAERFGAVLAFSPGFVAGERRRGRPRIFISHGTRDRVLPVAACSRRIASRLHAAGYAVRYDEFDGPHAVPAAIVGDAIRFWLDGAR